MRGVASRRAVVGAGIGLGLLTLAGPAWAQFDKYGHFNQNATEFDDVCAGAEGSFACGPIALMNSLVFLQNTYTQFGTTLIGADPHATAVKLSEYMGCAPCTGTDTGKFFDGKKKYLEEVAPGKIVSKRYVKPTAADLKKEIDHKEDVELFIGYYDDAGKSLGGHYVTLYALSDAKLSFVDPGGEVGGPINGATDETIDYTFDDGLKQLLLSGYDGTPKGAKARIDFAFAESPKSVPEPAVWVTMLLGFGVLGARLRRTSTVRRAGA